MAGVIVRREGTHRETPRRDRMRMETEIEIR